MQAQAGATAAEAAAKNVVPIMKVALVGTVAVGVTLLGYSWYEGKGVGDAAGGGLGSSVFGFVTGYYKALFGGIYDTVAPIAHEMRQASYPRGAGKVPEKDKCPSGYRTDPLTCYKFGGNPDVIGRYNKGTCKPGWQLDAGLCYRRCGDGFVGKGPVCWRHQSSTTKDKNMKDLNDEHDKYVDNK